MPEFSFADKSLLEQKAYIRDNSAAAFGQIALSRIKDQGNLTELSLDPQNDMLLFAAGAVASHVEGGWTSADPETLSLAHGVLDRAVQLRRGGTVAFEEDYTLDRHEERPVVNAETESEFWRGLSVLASQRSEIPTVRITDLYNSWRGNFIKRRREKSAAQMLAEHGVDSNIDPTPDQISHMEVAVSRGSIIYDTADELLTDMRSYFLPHLPSEVTFLPPGIYREDKNIMAKFEEEIKAWSSHRQGAYRYSEDYGSGDPFNYSAQLFSGQDIRVENAMNGQLRLRITGRAYSHNEHNPTQQIDNFAAYVGRDVVHEGPIRVRYTGQPPEELKIGNIVDDLHGSIKAVTVSMPVEKPLRQLQKLLGLNDETIEGIWQNILFGDNYTPITEGAREIQPYFPRKLFAEPRCSTDNIAAEGYSPIRYSDSTGEQNFALPQLDIEISQLGNPAEEDKQAKLMLAIQTIIARHHQWKNYSNGRVDSYHNFIPKAAL